MDAQTPQEPQLINIEKLIRTNKNPKLRKLPLFLIRRVERLFHQAQVNEAILKDADKYGVDFIKGNLEYLNVKIRATGLENIPKEGRYIYVCNHALGGLDFYAAAVSAEQKHPKIKVIANELLTALVNLQTIFLPVNVFSKNPPEAKRAIYDVLKSEDTQLMTFPSGTVARKYKGVLDDGNWHPAFIKHAKEYQRDVIPVFVDDENSKRFYRISNFRKRIGIKADLELFFLMDELFKKSNSTISVIFGKPIPYTKFTDDKTTIEWAQEVKRIAYALKEQTTQTEKPIIS